MIYKELSLIYKAIAAFQEPLRLLVVDTKESFFKEDCADRYIAFCKQQSIDIARIDPLELAQYQSEMTDPYRLFQRKKLYVLQDITSLKEKRVAEILDTVRNAHEDCYVLVLEGGSAHKQLLEMAQSVGSVFVIPSIKPWDKVPLVTQWIVAFVKKRSRTILQEVAHLLAQRFHNDYHALRSEIEKLITGCTDSSCITAQDLESLGLIDSSSSIFSLFDAFLKRDLSAVASLLISTSEVYDIGLLRFFKSQFEKLLTLSESDGEVKTKSQERQLAQIRSLGSRTVISWINEIKSYEIDVRSGLKQIDNDRLFDFFIAIRTRY